MAFTEFCCRASGSNLNGGAIASNGEPATTAVYTATNGGWNSGTGVFTPTAGDPSATVTVGDFASVYTDGATLSVFIARVTAVNSTTITVSTTAKAGTAPGTSASGISINVGGAWLGPNAAVGFPLTFMGVAATNAAGDTPRINLKNDQTYSVTANIAPSTTQNSLVFEGYTSTFGDGGRATIDGGSAGASYILYQPAVNKLLHRYLIFANNGATGNATGVSPSSNCEFFSCVFHDFRGIGAFGGRHVECEAYLCNTSNSVGLSGFYAIAYGERCISHDNAGSNNSGFATISGILTHCVADTNGKLGFELTNSSSLANCEAYNNTSHGIQISGTTSIVSITNCNLIKNGGYGIFGSGTPGGVIVNCGFGSGTQANTSGTTSAIGSIIESGTVTYAADVTPWTDPADGDFRISLAAAKQAGRGTFTQTQSGYGDPNATVAYPDIGAADAVASAAGASSPGSLSGGIYQ